MLESAMLYFISCYINKKLLLLLFGVGDIPVNMINQ